MNLATSCFRSVNSKINNIYKLGYVSRSIVTIADYKIKWIRPQRISAMDPRQSGDVEIKVDIKPTDIKLYYRDSKELEDADVNVKKMYSLQFQPSKATRDVKREEIIGLVKRHICDRGSSEAKIAAMTSQIQDFQKYMEVNPRNKHAKVYLKELIDKRKKYLKLLRNWDYRRFEWTLERLNLIYKPIPRKPGMVTRKESLRMVTENHCNEIIQEKRDAYKAELIAQQKDFYHEKVEKLKYILMEEKKYGLKPTVTEEDIEAARKKVKELQSN